MMQFCRTAVFLPDKQELLIHYDCGGGNKGPVCGGAAYGRTFQLRSLDFGVTWQPAEPLNGFLGVWDGVAPGPGAGLRLRGDTCPSPETPFAGRLFMAGHHDLPTELDVAWYSDDSGGTWSMSNVTSAAAGSPRRQLQEWPKENEFSGFDEPQFTELRNGSVLMSMRLDAHGVIPYFNFN